MSLKPILATSAAIWAGLVFVALSARASFSVEPITASEYVAWIFLAGAPAALALMVGRAMPPQTIAQVLYDAERDDTASGRPRGALPPLSADDHRP